MTVPEMGKLLGLKKTDQYWLVHKNVFESKEIAGKIRINIASFEKWYANQIKYHSNVLHFHISDNRIDIVGNQGCLTVIHRHAPFFLPIRGNKIIQKI